MINTVRAGAVIRKELAEIRRNKFIVATSCILPVIFLVEPTVSILLIKASATSSVLATRVDTALFLPLLVPVLIPATMSAFSVVGEREQGTLEPVLTTPVTRMELIGGKAAAIFMPAVALSYLMFGVFIAIVALFAKPAVATEMWNAPQLPAEVIFIPLLAAWAIWVGLAVSSRVSDTRVAQQFSVLASVPAIALVALMSFRIVSPSLGLAVVLALALLAIDCGACLVVVRLFDRERLVTGARPTQRTVTPGTVRRLPPVRQLGGTS
jgi:ABC-type transport system involved in multi-copper enzyme maturation permease subunit